MSTSPLSARLLPCVLLGAVLASGLALDLPDRSFDLNINRMTIENELKNVSVNLHFDSEDVKAQAHPLLLQVLSQLATSSGKGSNSVKEPKPHSPKRLMSFKWQDCGGPNELAKLKGLSVSPDPLPLPGNISFKFAVDIAKTIAAPIQVHLEVEKHESFFWLPIPCIDGVGSCTYSDVCARLAKAHCPPVLVKNKIPCKCPFPKGSYSIPTVTYAVDQSVPSGDYRVKISVTAGSSQVTCVQVSATIN